MKKTLVRDTLKATVRDPVAVITLLAVLGLIYLAASGLEIPGILAGVVAALVGILAARRWPQG